MSAATQGTGRHARAGNWTRLALAALLTGTGLAAAPAPAQAVMAGIERPSGLPWASGVNGSSSENAAFATWRGGRKLDVRTMFFAVQDWTRMASNAQALSTGINGGTGRLVTAIGMLPKTHTGQLAQCAAGQFDPQIRAVTIKTRAVTTNMLNHGVQAAANAGKPVIVHRTGANPNPIAATRHYITQGYATGVYTFSKRPQYWLRYIASHVELIPSLKTQASAGELHYHNIGKWQGRSVTFDSLAYLRANAGVRAVCGNTDQTCATKYFIHGKL